MDYNMTFEEMINKELNIYMIIEVRLNYLRSRKASIAKKLHDMPDSLIDSPVFIELKNEVLQYQCTIDELNSIMDTHNKIMDNQF